MNNAAGQLAAHKQQTASFFATGDGVRTSYRVDGEPTLPSLVLANSIGTTLHMWDGQIEKLERHFRVVRYDFRGHGSSDVPAGAYSDARLGRDVIELMDHLGIERTHFLGLSLGGYVGQWLAIHAPDRIDRLILSNTSAHLGPAEYWDDAIRAILTAEDMKQTAENFLRNWFPDGMFKTDLPTIRTFREMLLKTSRQGIAGNWAAVRDSDMRRTIALINAPTLAIAGEFDTITTRKMGEDIARSIPGARLKILPAVHQPNIELPAEFLREVLDFLLKT
ncbi:alpha/beta fold hydrolase [Candidatus Phyllobacterium onerii]|uniref:alpha/beta fold hydrolase n=1 Tax=Candidatus Phyllobacterium onerii TaxID=3020828 RepID=UPI003A85391C